MQIKITSKQIKGNDFSLLENSLSPNRSSHLFIQADSECIVYTSQDFNQLFKAIEEAQKNNLFAVGYFSYGCANFLMESIKKLDSKASVRPIAHFVFYQQHYLLDRHQTQDIIKKISYAQDDQRIDEVIYNLSFDTTYTEYQEGFSQIQSHLLSGNTYQVNYTGQYHFQFQGNYFNLYQRLRKLQPVRYSAFLPFSTGHVLSFSPELFFTKQSDSVHVRPMKGTVPRTGNMEQDDDQIKFLKTDLKNNAENLIIVDLLRNDLARISEVGSIKATSLFDIEAYKTVYQMTSTVQSIVKRNLSIRNILQSMFPCGSITGAPKKSTMNIIDQVEQNQRELYTGSIGYITPNNDMSFSVAIRTLEFNAYNQGTLGVGGGITTRSNVLDEWQEMHLKAKFFLDLPKKFHLIETLLFDREYVFLEPHLERLSISSKKLGFTFDKNNLENKLIELKHKFHQRQYKIRILLSSHGALSISYNEIDLKCFSKNGLICGLTDYKINQGNILYQHKTTAAKTRGIYNDYYDQAIKQNYHDVIFQNKLGNLTETTCYNIIYQEAGQLYTPPVGDGLLPGVYRQYLIDSGKVQVKSIHKDQLHKIEKLFLCNSVRGMFIVEYQELLL